MYGANKVRNMARSVLPSKKRKTSKENITAVKRHGRRVLRQQIASVHDDWDDVESDLTSYPIKEIRTKVFERREADNVSAIMRWAPRHVADEPIENRLEILRGELPHNPIGDHAISHVRYADEMTPPVEHELFLIENSRIYADWEKDKLALRERVNMVMSELLYAIIAEGWLKEFNNHFSARHFSYDPVSCKYSMKQGIKPLLGIHDIKRYLDTLPRDIKGTLDNWINWTQANTTIKVPIHWIVKP